MKKIISAFLVSNLLTVFSPSFSSAENSSDMFNESLAVLDLPTGLRLTEVNGEPLADPSWLRALNDHENKKYIFELKSGGDKSVVQVNMDSKNGGVKEVVTYFSENTEMRYTSFGPDHKVEIMTICWDPHECVTLNHAFCSKINRANSDKLDQTIASNPEKLFVLQQKNTDIMLDSSAAKHMISHFSIDSKAAGNSSPWLTPKQVEVRAPEILRICRNILAKDRKNISKSDDVKPISKKPHLQSN